MSKPDVEGATPAMQQWFALKAEHPDTLLFFRMGDFYELFFHDAAAAVAALDIQLTHRGEHAGSPIPMCGVPAHAAEAYLSRLIRRGYRVAVAEQMEKPQRGSKVPVRRQVVRVVTPGTLTDDALLEPGTPNILLVLALGVGRLGAAWMDISTGLFETAAPDPAELPALLGRLDPAEILAPAAIPLGDFTARRGPVQEPPSPDAARRQLAERFGVGSLDALGTFGDAEAMAAATALHYACGNHAGRMPRLSRPMPTGQAGLMAMDAATRASLEITRGRDGGADHTLLSAIGHTLTAAGCRMLTAWLHAPLTDPAAIAARQERWVWLLAHPTKLAQLRVALRGVPDMARALGRLSLGRCLPRDLVAIRDGLAGADTLAELLHAAAPYAAESPALHVPPTLRDMLDRALIARPDSAGAILAGYDGALDAHRRLRDDSRQVIAAMQLDFAQRYGVASLKIRHHQQLGYVIEAPLAAVEALRARPELQLRQGMANAARFTHPDLSALDVKITEAAAAAEAREAAILDHLTQTVLGHADAVAACADAMARLDAAQSAALLAEGGRWCRPVVDDGDGFAIVAGRHPVVEAALESRHGFMPNSCDLSPDRRLLLLTGPNMAGKSTFLRQNALIAVLAQTGLPVPAESARLGVVDRLFSRVGASDDLARGRSTFMVEMTETAAILHGAGPKSLVVVDEIGRGTATLDGLAIAWAVLEGLHFGNRCRTIFATHFHELAKLGATLHRLRPHTMVVRETGKQVVFLHEIAEGQGGRSWGVHVARLAGVPAPVVRRAGQLLEKLERDGPIAGPMTGPATLPLFAAATPAPFSANTATTTEPVAETGWDAPGDAQREGRLRQALVDLDMDQLTPREAVETLHFLKLLAAGQDAVE